MEGWTFHSNGGASVRFSVLQTSGGFWSEFPGISASLLLSRSRYLGFLGPDARLGLPVKSKPGLAVKPGAVFSTPRHD